MKRWADSDPAVPRGGSTEISQTKKKTGKREQQKEKTWAFKKGNQEQKSKPPGISGTHENKKKDQNTSTNGPTVDREGTQGRKLRQKRNGTGGSRRDARGSKTEKGTIPPAKEPAVEVENYNRRKEASGLVEVPKKKGNGRVCPVNG